MTVPLGGIPLADHAAVYAALDDAGFTDVWSSEVAGADGFTPLALAAAWSPRLRLGTAITPVFTRGPGLLAMSAAALAEAAPGRFALGVGASSPVLVRDWNAIEFDEPFKRTRDVLRFLRAALRGETVDGAFDTFAVRRFTLERPPSVPPPVVLAALRPGMLRLAAAEADGVILNWLAAEDVPTALAEVGERRPGFEVAARIFVCPTEDAAYARALGRRMITGYLTVPAYAAFHRWLGREDTLGPMWAAWAAGDRRGASAAVPDEVVDALVLHGSPEQCAAAVRRYADNGVDVPVLAVLPTPEITEGGAAAWMDLLPRLGPGKVA
ncbi:MULTISPECIES: LLM class F420-dependent oxidoreductase [Micromonospora]|uniref:LLM class F420-dependent oxidoreductase n=1 Tax=Micromonospora chalcea TaxID=1874 RepID=A0ABX9YCW1_MICCH|nr:MULTISPECIES: LLM class F420-dependent oxidoreductase [Micromonospora]MCK1804971.1 LLM class F420-dependent oxidoreductase [Micromonospora sp. R42106]MCK1834699.1 LLM class F420-dependent oxidoreductase [Micromonospora sp. R42003]MCK1846592.1 LLM class F420-dependent oxidoreductase [Micromonospora sp. R42004]MCM1018862.1 LLM class F420-dependent oxidoreductase [Micromonospora sp. XM-20-01]ODB80450.1 LLM class F420-dependent oxidoreductase [Micromonospora sp. II]